MYSESENLDARDVHQKHIRLASARAGEREMRVAGVRALRGAKATQADGVVAEEEVFTFCKHFSVVIDEQKV